MRVLIADKDTLFSKILKSLLGDYGHEPEIATDALDCVNILRISRPDVLVLDHDLLWGGSEGVLQFLCEDPAFSTLPVILTGAGEIRDGASAQSYGLISLLQKPYRLGDLLTQLNHAREMTRFAEWRLTDSPI